MKKKLLVTGAGGFVAGSVIAHARKEWEVHATGRRNIPGGPEDVIFYRLDLLENDKLTRLFRSVNPDAIIHTAAIADIDFCQNNRETAEKVNTGITRTLTGLCEENGAKMVFCSTDNVFDGQKGLYREADAPHPVNFYGETKIKAEEIVSRIENSTAARLTLVVGLPLTGKGNSFLVKVMKNLQAGEQIKFPVNEIRTPIDVITAGSALVELAGSDFTGTIHLAGNTSLTRYEMGRVIAEKLGYSKDLIIATDSNAIAGRAPRPQDVSLDNSLARNVLKTPVLSLSEGLELAINYKMKIT